MAKKRIFELPETKGKFELSGIINGTKKDNFYKEIKTKTKKNMRIVNYGLSYDKDCAVYENLTGMEKEKVYFSKKTQDNKVETEAVSWADRFSFNKEGYRLMGVNTGVKKKLNEEGKEVNDKKYLVFFLVDLFNINGEKQKVRHDGISNYIFKQCINKYKKRLYI